MMVMPRQDYEALMALAGGLADDEDDDVAIYDSRKAEIAAAPARLTLSKNWPRLSTCRLHGSPHAR